MSAMRVLYSTFHGFVLAFRGTLNGGSAHHREVMEACEENIRTREKLCLEIRDLKRMVRENEINSGVRPAVGDDEEE